MQRNFESNRINIRGAAVASALVLSLWSANASTLLAQDDSWLLKISEKELQLANPTDPMWMKSNMWDISFERMNDRNMPVLELSNVQAAGSPDIVEFKMTIGDTRFHFADDFLGAGAVLGNTTPGFNLTPVISDGGNLLTIGITKQGGGGISPGELVRFKIDIDVDAGLVDPPFFVHPDYRTVLFDMNGIQVYGPDPNFPPPTEDNAQASVRFSDNTTEGPSVFEDATVVGPQAQFFNANFRPYGIMEPVDIFETGGGTVIPEPSSAILSVLGLGALWLKARSRRARLA